MIDWIYAGDFKFGKLTGKSKLVYVTEPEKGTEYEGDSSMENPRRGHAPR